jgi:hypothetical protein
MAQSPFLARGDPHSLPPLPIIVNRESLDVPRHPGLSLWCVLTDSPAVIPKETDPISAVDSQADPITSEVTRSPLLLDLHRLRSLPSHGGKKCEDSAVH